MTVISNVLQELESIPPGVTRINNKFVTCNNRYLAYASYVNVYIYDLETFHLSRIFLSKSELIVTIRFPNKSTNFLAISLQKFIVVYDLESNTIINVVSTTTDLPTLIWSHDDSLILLLRYSHNKLFYFDSNISNYASLNRKPKNNSIFYFTESIQYNVDISSMETEFQIQNINKRDSFHYYFDSSQFNSVQKISSSGFPFSNVIFASSVSIKNQSVFIFGSDQGELIRVNFHETKFASFKGGKELGRITGIDFDPLNPMNCLTIWSNGYILFFDISSDEKIIEINRTDYSRNTNFKNLSGVCFLTTSPGQFLTGNLNTGTLQLWNITSNEPLENITIGNSGVKEIEHVKNNIIITFLEGSTCIIDSVTRNKKWENGAAHTNTIFAVQFMPNNPNLFVTCSADGSLCTWDATTMKQVSRFVSENMQFMCLSITSGGGYLIVGSTNGFIAVFNIHTLKICYSVKIFDQSNGRIMCISNSPLQPELILVNDDNGYCCLFNLESQKTVWSLPITHLEKIRGSSMSMHRKDTMALACTKGILKLVINLKIHQLKYDDETDLHRAIFSPHNERHLLTSTDSGIVIFWDIDYENPTNFTTKVVSRHGSKSRAIAFHPTYPNIGISGGYNGKLCLFDYINNTQICTVSAHLDHIYDVCFSPNNPFLLISTSRDLSIKKWTIDKLFESKLYNHFIFRPLDGSLELQNMINRLQKTGKFTFKENTQFHINDSIRIASKRISKMLSNSPHETSLIKKAIKSKQRMIKAAELALMIGNNKQYCELLFAAGEYDKAVAAAPSVSYQFWYNMMRERMKLFEDTNDQMNACILLNDYDSIDKLMNTSSKSYDDAMLIKASQKFKDKVLKITKIDKKDKDDNEYEYVDLNFVDNEKLFEYSVASKEAGFYLKQGKIFRACSSLLAVGDVRSAVLLLYNNGEFMTSAFLANKFNLLDEKMAIQLMYINSDDIWPELPLNLQIFVFPLLSSETRVKFKNDFESIYTKRAKTNLSAYENMFDMLIDSCLSESHSLDHIISFGIQYLIDHVIKNIVFDFSEIKSILLVFELIQTSLIGKTELMILNLIEFYIAAIESFWKGFNEVTKHLIEMGQTILKANDFSSLLSSEDLEKMTTLFSNLERMISTENNYEITINPEGSEIIEKTLVTLDKNLSIPLKEILKFQNVTSFSPLATFNRIYVI